MRPSGPTLARACHPRRRCWQTVITPRVYRKCRRRWCRKAARSSAATTRTTARRANRCLAGKPTCRRRRDSYRKRRRRLVSSSTRITCGGFFVNSLPQIYARGIANVESAFVIKRRQHRPFDQRRPGNPNRREARRQCQRRHSGMRRIGEEDHRSQRDGHTSAPDEPGALSVRSGQLGSALIPRLDARTTWQIVVPDANAGGKLTRVHSKLLMSISGLISTCSTRRAARIRVRRPRRRRSMPSTGTWIEPGFYPIGQAVSSPLGSIGTVCRRRWFQCVW